MNLTKTNPLIKNCNKAIQKEIAKKYWKEAKEIILLTDDTMRNEFLKYYKEDKGNICCLVLDKAKYNLVVEGKLINKTEDGFGKPFLV